MWIARAPLVEIEEKERVALAELPTDAHRAPVRFAHF